MTPAFGFSAGDVVHAIGLIRKVQKALKDTGGASAEYQHVIIELNGLENVLRQLEALEPNENNVNQVNAIRGMALACQIPLRDFLTKVERYDSSMSPFSKRTSFKAMRHKTVWALSVNEDVTKLRALIAAKVLSINLILATFTSLDHRFEQDRMITASKLDNISTNIKRSASAMFSLRTLASQFASFMLSWPRETREQIRRILQNNYRIYHLLLDVQNSIVARPTTILDSDIKFEDALGRTMHLPYNYFHDWEVCPNIHLHSGHLVAAQLRVKRPIAGTHTKVGMSVTHNDDALGGEILVVQEKFPTNNFNNPLSMTAF
ncbi:MAG: hypothetical protein Q9222_005635, partial [Ikaeria aurantiellina]